MAKQTIRLSYESVAFGSKGRQSRCTTLRGVQKVVGKSLGYGGWNWVARGTEAALEALGAYRIEGGDMVLPLPDGRLLTAFAA